MNKSEQNRKAVQAGQKVATDLPREAGELIQLVLDVKAKTNLCIQSRQKVAELRHRAEFLKNRMQAAKTRAKWLRDIALEIRRKK